MSYRLQSKLWLCAAILLFAAELFGQSIRVTAWNLQAAAGSAAAASNDVRVAEAASVLKSIEPDVILLQNVPDWKTCDRLAEALNPAKYFVLVCSSFRNATNNTLSQQQVAVLSKYHAFSSWSEPWRGPDRKAGAGGFAFVALRIANQPLGFYSVELPAQSNIPAELAADQLSAHAQTVRKWEANKVDAMTASFTLGSDALALKDTRDTMLRAMQDAGFGVAVRESDTALPAGDFLLTEPPGLVAQPKILSNASFDHVAATCDVELEPAKLMAARAAELALAKSRPPRPPVKVVATSTPTNEPVKTQAAAGALAAPTPATVTTARAPAIDSKLIALIVVAGLALAAGVFWMVARRPQPVALAAPTGPKLLAESNAPSSYTIIVGSQSTTAGSSLDRLKPPTHPVVRIEAPLTTHTQTEMLRRRAEAAEERAHQAQEAIRTGVISNLSQWLKQKFVRKLVEDRSQMLETQHSATAKALAVEERLTRIEAQIKVQNLGYQQRIDDLTRQLIEAKEENRELIRAQIRQVKAEMDEARERMLAKARQEGAV